MGQSYHSRPLFRCRNFHGVIGCCFLTLKAMLSPRAATKRTQTDDRELLNRKIKATVAMLADPTFDGLDKLRTTLADLKSRRDAFATRLKPVDQPITPAITEDELRRWALAQFARLDDLATRTMVDLQDRQIVEAFVQRIEINPEAKTGEIILIANLADAFRQGSTREPIGDEPGARASGLFKLLLQRHSGSGFPLVSGANQMAIMPKT